MKNNDFIEDKVDFENGKYTMVLYKNGTFELLRHGEEWINHDNTCGFPSKMLIGVMYEVLALRKLVNDIQYDFNPDNGELGPKCGPEMLDSIKEHIARYGEL